MGTVCYYVAQSLDGFIADENHSVQWLESFDAGKSIKSADSTDLFQSENFFKEVHSVMMGARTYEFLLDFGGNPYAPKNTIVLSTHSERYPRMEAVRIINDPELNCLRELRMKEGRVWLVGGGNLAAQALQQGLLDEVILTIIPRTIGKGVPLFKSLHSEVKDWELLNTGKTEGGAAQMYFKLKVSNSN